MKSLGASHWGLGAANDCVSDPGIEMSPNASRKVCNLGWAFDFNWNFKDCEEETASSQGSLAWKLNSCGTLPELSGCGNSGTSHHNLLSPSSYVPLWAQETLLGSLLSNPDPFPSCCWLWENTSLCTDSRKNTLRGAFSVQILSFKMNLNFLQAAACKTMGRSCMPRPFLTVPGQSVRFLFNAVTPFNTAAALMESNLLVKSSHAEHLHFPKCGSKILNCFSLTLKTIMIVDHVLTFL